MNKNENWDSMPMWGTTTNIHADQSPLTLQEARQRLAGICSRRPTSLHLQRKYDLNYFTEVKTLKRFIRSQVKKDEGFLVWLFKSIFK